MDAFSTPSSPDRLRRRRPHSLSEDRAMQKRNTSFTRRASSRGAPPPAATSGAVANARKKDATMTACMALHGLPRPVAQRAASDCPPPPPSPPGGSISARAAEPAAQASGFACDRSRSRRTLVRSEPHTMDGTCRAAMRPRGHLDRPELPRRGQAPPPRRHPRRGLGDRSARAVAVRRPFSRMDRPGGPGLSSRR